jgi:alanine racemase
VSGGSGSTERPRHRQTWAEVDLEKLKFNFSRLKGLLPAGQFFCPMIKADAYGHGDVAVAQALRPHGATHLGVSLIEEGLKIREAGDVGGLLTFGVFEGVESAKAVVDANLTPVISEWQQLEALKEILKAPKRPFKIHLKFNTGMNRLGFLAHEATKLREWCDQNPSIQVEGVATHLLRGDDAGAPGGESEAQFAVFAKALEAFKGLNVAAHALNSSGEVNLSQRVADRKVLSQGIHWPLGARPGIALYGVAPTNDENVDLGLKPALKLVSHLVETRRMKKGDCVSYGATWKAERDSFIGVIPIGYADGIFRALSNKGSVLCRGVRAPIAGIVCMDLLMVDLTDIAGSIERGEEVILIGEQLGAEITATEIADLAQTIPYEVLTRLSSRVPRVYC